MTPEHMKIKSSRSYMKHLSGLECCLVKKLKMSVFWTFQVLNNVKTSNISVCSSKCKSRSDGAVGSTEWFCCLSETDHHQSKAITLTNVHSFLSSFLLLFPLPFAVLFVMVCTERAQFVVVLPSVLLGPLPLQLLEQVRGQEPVSHQATSQRAFARAPRTSLDSASRPKRTAGGFTARLAMHNLSLQWVS